MNSTSINLTPDFRFELFSKKDLVLRFFNLNSIKFAIYLKSSRISELFDLQYLSKNKMTSLESIYPELELSKAFITGKYSLGFSV